MSLGEFMTDNILNATYEEIDKIKELDAYKALVSINEKIKVELKDLIIEFNKTKELFNKAQDNIYSNEYKQISQKLSELRIKIESEPLVIEYHKYERIINEYLDNIKKEMLMAVRGEA